jgi:hypothetical protein
VLLELPPPVLDEREPPPVELLALAIAPPLPVGPPPSA